MLEEEMLRAAQELEFEKAAELRDLVNRVKDDPALMSGEATLRLSDLRGGRGSSSGAGKKPGSAGSKAGSKRKKRKKPGSSV
jgi:hypothetical protein